MFPLNRTILCSGDRFRNDNSVYFDGVDDALQFNSPANTLSSNNGDFNTIAVWFKLDPSAVANLRVWNVESSNPGLLMVKDGNNWEIGYNSAAAERIGVELSEDYFSGKWVHAILSFERQNFGGQQTLNNTPGTLLPLFWLNGVRQTATYVRSSASHSANHNSNSKLSLGSNQHNGNNSQPFHGWISDFAVYKGLKFDNQMAKTVYNERNPFNHNEWKHAKDLTVWSMLGGGNSPTVPNYGLMTDLISADSSDAANNGANIYGDNNTRFNFQSNTSTASLTDGYNVATNSLFTVDNATALITHDTVTRLKIANTDTEYGTMNAVIPVENGAKYWLFISFWKEESAYASHATNIKVGKSGQNSIDYYNLNIGGANSRISKQVTSTGTTLNLSIGPDDNSIGSHVGIRVIHLYKINRQLSLRNTSNITAATPFLGEGDVVITGDSPHD
tara:strand:- start:3495 stop:4832 length:1338 start_codon:yes stop_codon:yes gene_type:complete